MNHLVRNRHLVEDLGGALRSGKHGLAVVPSLLKRVLVEESWREFVTQRGEHVTHKRFSDFVEQAPLRGLGADLALIRRVVAADTEAVDLLDRASQRPVGVNQHTMARDNDTTHDPNTRGTSKEYALRRLRKDAPDLHAEVLAGNLSAHAAMVKAGLTPPRFTVHVTTPQAVAGTLRRRLPPDVLAAVVAELTG